MSRLFIHHVPVFKAYNAKYHTRRWKHSSAHKPKLLPSTRNFASVIQPETSQIGSLCNNDNIVVPLSALRRLKEPWSAPIPLHLEAIYRDEDDDVAITFNSRGVRLRGNVKLALNPMLHEEVARRLSLQPVGCKTIIFTSQEIADILNAKLARKTLRKQFAKCINTKDIFHVMIVALRSRYWKKELAPVTEEILNAFYRARTTTSDLSIAKMMAIMIRRFEQENIPVRSIFFEKGLCYAIRSRDLKMTKRFLWEYRVRNLPLGIRAFRRFIGKCSIGYRGFGEIRNGKWKKEDLIQVLLGFPGTAPGKEHHLGWFLDRSKFPELFHWLKIIAQLGLKDELWKEWISWKERHADDRHLAKREEQNFVHQFINCGEFKTAWQIIKECKLNPITLYQDRLYALLENTESATIWSEELDNLLLEKLDADISAIEHFLGVRWVSNGDGEEGYHRPTERLQEALEEISDKDFFRVYGWFEDQR